MKVYAIEFFDHEYWTIEGSTLYTSKERAEQVCKELGARTHWSAGRFEVVEFDVEE